MKETLYIETSIVSYLTARPSRDLVIAAHQQITNDWWENNRVEFYLFTSQLVLDEASAGDAVAAKRRFAKLDEIPLLEISNEIIILTDELMKNHCLPAKAIEDALHISIASVHSMNYLLTSISLMQKCAH